MFLLLFLQGEITQKIRVRKIVLGDPGWIWKVAVLLYNLFSETFCMDHITGSNWNWWAYSTKCTSAHLAADPAIQGETPFYFRVPKWWGAILLLCHFVGVLPVNMEHSVPKFENCLLSSLNQQVILLVLPGSFGDAALHLTSVSVYV